MAKGSCTFRKADITRLLSAAAQAGFKVGRVEVDKAGKIALVPDHDGREETESQSNEWDTLD
jgi:hypothetical protein